MNAVISGRAGFALLIEGESLMSLDVDDLETLVPRRRSDLRFLLADATDLVTLENADRAEIAQRLDLEHDIACALDMTLIALDPDSSMELRSEAVAALDELLADTRVIERLEFTMYAKPLPASADLMGALFCTEVKTAAARSFFERLDRDQAAIQAVREAWDSLPDSLFGDDPSAKAVFHDAACNEGLFRLLALSYGDQAELSALLLEALKNSAIRNLRNHRGVIQQWSAPSRAAADTDTPVIESEYDDDYQEATETRHHLTAEVSSSSHSAVQVFISYARADEQKVKEIYRGLFEQNFKPWMDTADILPGENWVFAIQTAIRQSRFFIACLSKDSVDRRGFIQKEMREALDIWQEQQALDICLIPVRLDDCVVPEGLSRFHLADLFAEDGWIRLMDAIREDIRRRQAKE